MKAARTSHGLWGVSLVLITVVFCPVAQSKVIRVDDDGPADFGRIQAGIDAAGDGDIVSVAPGIYLENVTLKDGVSLIGSGVDVTIIDANGYGDVVDARANDAAIAGFTLRNSGESGATHMTCGVYVNGDFAPVVKGNVIIGNKVGIGLWYGARPDVRNNVIENNSEGLYLYGSEESSTDPNIINNTIVGNGSDGIVLREEVSPVIANNIIVGQVGGINHNYVTGVPVLRYNNLWDNDVSYLRDGRVDDTLARPGSMSVNPRFARGGYWADANDPDAVWVAGNYHLKSQAGRYDPNSRTWVLDDVTSPCIDAGDPNSPVGFEPAPNGGIINLGAYGGTAKASKSPSRRHAKYGGGTGGPSNPYLIYTAEQMDTIGAEPNDWGKCFKLIADIDLSAFDGKNGRPVFHMIAPDTKPDLYYQGIAFTGTFDGGTHKLSHLTITGDSYLGLFGQLASGAVVHDLGIEDVNVTGSGDAIAALAAESRGAVTHCYSTGVVTATGRARDRGYNVGGLIASAFGDVTFCHSTASVTGGTYVGGFVGSNWGIITRCYSTGPVRGGGSVGGFVGENLSVMERCCAWGPVTGETYVGGLVGENYQGFVTDCYSSGAASGNWYVGGLVGHNGALTQAGKQAAVTRCYSAGAVKGQSYVGGLVGQNQATVTGSFWDRQTSGQTTSGGGTGKTTTELRKAKTFRDAGWDFVGETVNGAEDTWWIDEGKDYPRLSWEQGDGASP